MADKLSGASVPPLSRMAIETPTHHAALNHDTIAWAKKQPANANFQRRVIDLTRMSSATAGDNARGLQGKCSHNLVRSTGTASGSLQRWVRSLHQK
jgi:hypothetical protein